MRVSFFGSSLVSSYWNGAATYYRGLLREMASRGHVVTFYEPDAYERQAHRDIPDPPWARVVVYEASPSGVECALREGASADLVVKASGVGVFDGWLEENVLRLQSPGRLIAFWDVDAPATLERMHGNPEDAFRALVPRYDVVFTYGGGRAVIDDYQSFGARVCLPIYNALDPTTHFATAKDPAFEGTLGFLGNRLPDREARVEEFFFDVARARPGETFVLGGAGWNPSTLPPNVRYVGHVSTNQHNAFNASVKAVLNVHRESMARYGTSPATRVFEAAGAGACLISDAAEGLDLFLRPGTEILLARTGAEVARHLDALTPETAAAVGRAARLRIIRGHTYAHRAAEVDEVLAAVARSSAQRSSRAREGSRP